MPHGVPGGSGGAHLALTALLLCAHLLACGGARHVEEAHPLRRAARGGPQDLALRRRRLAQAAPAEEGERLLWLSL